MHKKLTTPDELHNEKDLLLSLEHILHTYQEWMVSLLKNFFLK
jgi:hypothetical protein